MLLDMTRTHVPVLAGELIDLTAPAAGETAVDCTFGAGGHARLVADRLGPAGTLVCIDRDPAAEERFEELAREAPCETRFLRMDYADGLSRCWPRRALEADLVYLDLGISSMQVDARERGFSYSYDAPLDMRMDPDQDAGRARDRERLGGAPPLAALPPLRRGALRAPDRARDRAPARRARRSTPPASSWRPWRPRCPRPCGAASAAGHPAKRVFQAVRIAVNDELESLDRALPLAWELLRDGGPAGRHLLPLARGPARQALPGRARARLRVPARLPRLRLRARARGGAAHPPRRGAHARRGGRQPALALRASCAPPASSAPGEARLMAPRRQRRRPAAAPATRGRRGRARRARPARRSAGPARPPRRMSGPRRAGARAAGAVRAARPRARRARSRAPCGTAPAGCSTPCSPVAAGSCCRACCWWASSSSTSTSCG